jgi:hypothetical protein
MPAHASINVPSAEKCSLDISSRTCGRFSTATKICYRGKRKVSRVGRTGGVARNRRSLARDPQHAQIGDHCQFEAVADPSVLFSKLRNRQSINPVILGVYVDKFHKCYLPTEIESSHQTIVSSHYLEPNAFAVEHFGLWRRWISPDGGLHHKYVRI